MRVELVDLIWQGNPFANRLTLPRRGLSQIGTILANAGHEVYVSSESVQTIDWEKVSGADLVGFSVLTCHAPRIYSSAKLLKERAKESDRRIGIIMGGPHVTALPEEALINGADFVVRHEGEEIVVPLITAWEEQDEDSFRMISNLSWRTATGELVHNPSVFKRVDLNNYPIPDLNLIRGWKKPGSALLNYHYYPLESSRGCVHECEFCYSPAMFPGRVTYRDNEVVVEEIGQQIGQGHNRFLFTDDNFLLNPKRVQNLLEIMARRGVKCKAWTAQLGVETIIKADKITPDVFRLMKLTGAGRQFVAIESINPDTLSDDYKKPQNLDEIEEAVSILNRHKIPIHAMFVLGGDNDTVETIRATSEFTVTHDLKTISATVLTPLPGTPVFARLQKEGRLLAGEQDFPARWTYYDMYHPEFRPRHMSPDQLRELTFKVLKKFYSIPRIMQDIGNPEEFLGKLYVSLRVIPRLQRS